MEWIQNGQSAAQISGLCQNGGDRQLHPRGMGVSILPDMILRRIPYRLEIRSLQTPYYRPIGLAMKRGLHPAPAVRKLIEYLPFREAAHE